MESSDRDMEIERSGVQDMETSDRNLESNWAADLRKEAVLLVPRNEFNATRKIGFSLDLF
jgi:hypothetical protein